MGVRGSGSLPVVDGTGHLRGLITRAHILAVYERQLAAAGSGTDAPAEPAPRNEPVAPGD